MRLRHSGMKLYRNTGNNTAAGKKSFRQPYFFALKQKNIAVQTVQFHQKEKSIGFLFAHLDKMR